MRRVQLVQDDYHITEDVSVGQAKNRWGQTDYKVHEVVEKNWDWRDEFNRKNGDIWVTWRALRWGLHRYRSGIHTHTQKRREKDLEPKVYTYNSQDMSEPIPLLITELLTVPSCVSSRKAVCSSRLRSSGRAGEEDFSDSCSDLSDACSISAILICCEKVSSI